MCGIVAVLGATDNAATRKLILDLSRRLRHRGPDWSGIHQARGRGMTEHGEGRRAATYEFCDSFIRMRPRNGDCLFTAATLDLGS